MAQRHNTMIQGKPLRTPVVNVDVTGEIIDGSIMRDSSHCMIAEAVQEAVPWARHISVDLQTIRFSDPEKRIRYIYLTPRIGQVALVRYDQGQRPAPFRFRLSRGQATPMSGQRNPENRDARNAMTAARRRAKLAGEEWDPAKWREENGYPPAAPARGPKRNRPRQIVEGSQNDLRAQVRIEGGQPPPVGGFARRRQFGIRSLEI